MPTYTEKWIPAYAPVAADLSNWKALYNEFNAKLLAAGLVSADDGGALNIDAVSALPAMGAYAGYKLFAFNDALQATAPVIIKIEYGVGKMALAYSSGNTPNNTFPRIRISVVFNGNSTPAKWMCPTGYDGHSSSPTTTVTITPGLSYIVYSPEKGFFGVTNGAGAYHTEYYADITRGGVATFFVGREPDAAGAPTANGIVVYAPLLDVAAAGGAVNVWGQGNYQPALAQYMSADGTVKLSSRLWASRVGGVESTRVADVIQVQKVFFRNPEIKVFPWLVTYNPGDIPDGTEFDVEVFPGTTHRFVALGNKNSAAPDKTVGELAAFAMVFE